jgi:hypothetical protein
LEFVSAVWLRRDPVLQTGISEHAADTSFDIEGYLDVFSPLLCILPFPLYLIKQYKEQEEVYSI